MFEDFYQFFNVTERKGHYSSIKLNNLQANTNGFYELFSSSNGQSFGYGLYRLHDITKIEYWNNIISKGFPEFSGRISCFGYDWLGRQFALDNQRKENGQAQILMFEPGTGEVLEIPCNFYDFHNEEIPNYHDACLASDFFQSWSETNKSTLKHDECVGYKIMLFLGGEDTLENLEMSNLDVYWEICNNVLQKTKGMSDGSTIKFNK
ncbi:T6SS immunity protein Tdi1 domain-containing protein [Neobacillus niacini]|uniref:T6SS immunity protein Tdi1 domain-containing protein n=1 Tax=Neobacillus niacini TaxID=86668 RepID=UPI0028577850|nr:T6SS immunity protein Tdi1 domain-containing protein [Neobacillus niacini]MDR7002894.1 hypothetical protein [Neobacillus niacini]